jgi:hypothetical protein
VPSFPLFVRECVYWVLAILALAGTIDAAERARLVRARDARRAEIAAAVRREHFVADIHQLDRLGRSVGHRDRGARNEALIQVAYDHHAAVLLRQQANELPLRGVGVLELVDENVSEALAVPLQRLGCSLNNRTASTSRSSKSTADDLLQPPLVLGVDVGDAPLGRSDRHRGVPRRASTSSFLSALICACSWRAGTASGRGSGRGAPSR